MPRIAERSIMAIVTVDWISNTGVTMDRISKAQRRKNMQAVKGKNSKIEKKFAQALRSEGYKFKKNYAKVTGKPDIVFLPFKIAIFCDSEFWHGKNWRLKKHEIKSNRKFWYSKIESNIARDKEVNAILRNMGWIVLRFWGKEIENNADKCVQAIETVIRKRRDVRAIRVKKNK